MAEARSSHLRPSANLGTLPRSSNSNLDTIVTRDDDDDEEIYFPNPALSMLTSVARHAKHMCKQMVRISSSSSSSSSPGTQTKKSHHNPHPFGSSKAPNMAKMKIVTPVFDHEIQKWVWPDDVLVGDEEDDDDGDSKSSIFTASSSGRTQSRRPSRR